jgi:hypothetical protein
MWYCDDPPFRFIHNPRTAGTTMFSLLLRLYPWMKPYAVDPPDPDDLQYGDHGLDFPDHTREYYTFGFVREPYWRELSTFGRQEVDQLQQCPQEEWPRLYQEWLRYRLDVRQRPQAYPDLSDFDRLCLGTQRGFFRQFPTADVRRYENMPEAFLTLPILRGKVNAGQLRRTVRRPFGCELSPQLAYQDEGTVALLHELVAEDFEDYRYPHRRHEELLTYKRRPGYRRKARRSDKPTPAAYHPPPTIRRRDPRGVLPASDLEKLRPRPTPRGRDLEEVVDPLRAEILDVTPYRCPICGFAGQGEELTLHALMEHGLQGPLDYRREETPAN